MESFYLDAKNNCDSEDEFIAQLKKSFPGIGIEIIEKGRKYAVEYMHCACDLVMRGYITDPAFCECSRASLQYNWEAVYGQGNVKADMV